MKIINFKLIVCAIALTAASTLASAQVKDISHDFSSFDSIDIDYDFHVNVVKSEKNYSVTATVDDVLVEYVQTYVKGHTLYITLDKKSLPSDIKKLYKGRKSESPILNATVYMASDLSSVKMSGASTLSVQQDIECKEFNAEIDESAVINKLHVDASSFSIASDNKSTANLVVYADDIKITSTGNSTININQDSQKFEVNASGSSKIDADGESLETVLNTTASSKVVVKGKTDNLSIKGEGLSNVDALNLQTGDCSVELSGNCKVTEAAKNVLHISMKGSSTLVFDGEPVIDIINVKSSSISRFENSKK